MGKCLLLAVSLLCTLATGAWADVPGLIFHLPFDGSPKAATAAGESQPLAAEGITYGPGALGQAANVTGSAFLEYPAGANIVKEHGTVMLWFKPNWRPADMDDSKQSSWHCLFQERLAEGKERVGSGQLWLWFWGAMLRGDIAEPEDHYRTAGTSGMEQDAWAHIAFTWDAKRGSQLYLNGVPVGSTSDGSSPLKITKGGAYSAVANRFESFFVGSSSRWAQADGAIDEFRIYDRVLKPAEIVAEMAAVSPLRVDCLSPFVMETAGATKLRWNITNVGDRPREESFSWKVTGTPNQGRAGGTLAPGAQRGFDLDLNGLAAGRYTLVVEPAVGPARSASAWVMRGKNAYLKAPGQLVSEPVETIDFVKGIPTDRFVEQGESRKGELAGKSYYEAGPKKNDRFAVKVTLPEAGVPYLVEWDYPDDKLRTMEMVAQEAARPGSDYAMETGVFCGDEFPNSMQTRTHRSILWARAKDIAFIFMTARENAPAAVSQLRVSKVIGGLPDGGVKEAPAVGGWGRSIAIHFEDPSLGYDFGVDGQLMPHYEETLDRLVAYMKYSGQNLLTYPAVWYHGRIGPGYQPRLHEEDFIGCILTKFAAAGLGFMPAINLQNIRMLEDLEISETTVADGSLHSSPVMIFNTGKPNPGGWHGTPPNFNPLHPAVRSYVDSQVDDILDRYAASPAFKGIVLHLTKHTIPWFGSIEAGYNDYCIEAFERDTGVQVQVDRKDPLRGKLYYDWLMANARDQWVKWRCDQIAKWYRQIADRISTRRPDLKLALYSYSPTVTDFADDPRYGSPDFAMAIDRESGLDPALYADAGNIILAQTIYPADFRWRDDKSAKARDTLMLDHTNPGTYAPLREARFPWVNMHDRYFEDGIGGAGWWGKNAPLKAPWLKEVPWRVSTLNPGGQYFLEHYVMPLRYGDVLGFSKGGYLIGTAGVEEQLLAFSRAFRALPAERFKDLAGSTDTTKARVLRNADGTWFYAVNSSQGAVEVSFQFEGDAPQILDAATGRPESNPILLKPYELRSFRTEGQTPVSVKCALRNSAD